MPSSIVWSHKAALDLIRVHDFLAAIDQGAAVRVVRTLNRAVKRLSTMPLLGSSLDEFRPRDVRRLIVGNYEIRYEIREGDIAILRVWHTAEDR